MTDKTDDTRGRPPRGSGRPRSPRPEGGRPYRPRLDAERPARAEGEAHPPRAKRFEERRDAGERPPRRPREEGDRPFRPRPEGDRPFRARREEGERPSRPRRDEGERPFRARPPAGDRPVRPRRDDGPRAFGKPHSGDDRPRRAPARRVDPAPEPVAAAPAEPAEDRIAKVIARAGVASRRDAEAMIEAGRVTVNGETIASPALNVGPDAVITVDGEPLPAKERTRLWLYHKPRGLVTTARDPEGRPTVFDNLPEDLPRVVAIGRLDINTEGLLLLTNDGGLAKVIAHPDTGWLRRYRVRAHGDVDQAQLDALREGIAIEGMEYGPIEAAIDRAQGDNVWITMGLREGKNREIKRVLEHLGMRVNRLIRVSFGPFQLGDLEEGQAEEVRTRTLRDQLGERLAQEAEVDFAAPVRQPIAPFGTKPTPPERPERPRREAPPPRGRDRDEARPRRFEGDRPRRGFDEERRPRFARDDAPALKREPTGKQRSTVWRAEPEQAAEKPYRPKPPPRRGADPKAARQATNERPRERVGSVATAGGKVLVERLKAEPRPERPARAPRRPRFDDEVPRPASRGEGRPPRRFDADRPPRGEERPRRADGDRPPRRFEGDRPPPRARSGEDRPSRRFEGDRPARPFGARPARSDERGPRRGEDRPPRRFEGERGPRARSGDDRPRGPARGGFGSKPGGGRPGGGPRGPAKGPPRRPRP